MATRFEEWIETKTDFILITNREKEIARASWNAALTFIAELIENIKPKEGLPNND